MFDFNVDRTVNKREYKYSGGTVSIDRKDPYGLWEISDKTDFPPHLRGTYTSVDMLERDLFPYLNEVNSIVKILEEHPPVEKTKKAK